MSQTQKVPTVPKDLSGDDIQTSEKLKVYPTFESMNLKNEVLQGIAAFGKFFLND